jgi:hypothetical protein
VGKVVCVFLLVLLTPFVVHAELAVCFFTARPLGSQFSYNPSIDPSKVTDPACSVVTKASGQTDAQLALIHSTIRGAPAPKYLKVVGGLAVAMTTGEQDAVDADLAAKAAAQQAYVDEVSNQDFCNVADLTAVDAKVDAFYAASQATMTTALQAATNLATLKDAVTVVAQELVGQKVAMKKLLRCLISVRKGAR